MTRSIPGGNWLNSHRHPTGNWPPATINSRWEFAESPQVTTFSAIHPYRSAVPTLHDHPTHARNARTKTGPQTHSRPCSCPGICRREQTTELPRSACRRSQTAPSSQFAIDKSTVVTSSLWSRKPVQKVGDVTNARARVHAGKRGTT